MTLCCVVLLKGGADLSVRPSIHPSIRSSRSSADGSVDSARADSTSKQFDEVIVYDDRSRFLLLFSFIFLYFALRCSETLNVNIPYPRMSGFAKMLYGVFSHLRKLRLFFPSFSAATSTRRAMGANS